MPEIKRTLAEAMRIPKITPEALAIIKGGTPVSRTVAAADARAHEPNPKVQKAKSHPMISKEEPVAVEPSVPLTARVPMSIPQALLKAASERKQKKIRPYTHQDIIAEALQNWLHKNGYLPEKG